jgi:predicted short-subunit dehydrogenase-like oxidoreductase (DUF2520 family)
MGNWTETMNPAPSPAPDGPCARDVRARRIAVVGAGRVGTALARELRRAGHTVSGPLSRGYARADIAASDIVLLCVPDREIESAAADWRRVAGTAVGDALLGHCSGATGLQPLLEGPLRGAFSLHPLMTFPGGDAPVRLAGAAGAVAASTPEALHAARSLAEDLDLVAVSIPDGERAVYHAAASVASNYLVTLLVAAESLAGTCGVSRVTLAPLVRATVENWVADGAGALTGPIARGDEATVARQRDAVASRAPGQLELFDAMAGATRAIVPAEVAA